MLGIGIRDDARGALVGPDDLDHLGDDIAGALDDDTIADTDILALNLIFIVKACPGHHHPAHGHRLKHGHRCQGSGASHLDDDIVQHRFHLFGGEFMGDGPARGAAHEAEPLLVVEAVDLINHAVDVIGQGGALLFDIGVKSQDVFRAGAQPGERIGLKTPLAQAFEKSPVGVADIAARHLAAGIGEHMQGTRGRYRRIELA